MRWIGLAALAVAASVSATPASAAIILATDQGIVPPDYAGAFFPGASLAGDEASPFTYASSPASSLELTSVGIIPEPSAWLLIVLGAGGIGGAIRRRRAGPATTA